ncbi:MAG TPA: helix-turn-helix transcriptional regulator [Firmicutes bacterium]|nr:helix-turn-helix transcriptional regulator [Bacillota bacterium]
MLGERIRTFREKRGLTLQEVASRSGLSRSYLSEIENGKKQPSVKTLEALAAALNVALDALLPEEGMQAEAETLTGDSLGDRLRLARERKGMSLTEAAEAAGISVSYLSEIERGQAQPAVDTLRVLADIVSLPLSQVFHCGAVGDKVRLLREQLGLSRAELAEMAGVTPGFIAQLENNKTQASLATLKRIAQCLDVSPCYLLLEDDSAEEIIRGLNPELRALLQEPRVQLVLRMVCDMTDKEFEFLLQFIRLLRRSGLQ